MKLTIAVLSPTCYTLEWIKEHAGLQLLHIEHYSLVGECYVHGMLPGESFIETLLSWQQIEIV